MEEIRQQLDEYIAKSKKNSRLSQNDCNDVIKLLIKESSSTEDFNGWCNETVHVLNELHYEVTEAFFNNKFLMALDDEHRAKLITTFFRSEKIVQNASNFGAKRLELAAAALEKRKLFDLALKLRDAAEMYSKNKTSKAPDKERSNVADKTQSNENLISIPEQDASTLETQEPDTQKPNQTETDTPEQFKPKQKLSRKEIISKAIGTLQSEFSKTIKENLQLSVDVERLSAVVKSKEMEAERQEQRITDLIEQSNHHHNQLQAKDREISDCHKKISDLDERLKKAYQTDSMNINNEIVALKTGLNKDLQMEYDAFISLRSKSCSEECYEALTYLIDDIFGILKRKGIFTVNERD